MSVRLSVCLSGCLFSKAPSDLPYLLSLFGLAEEANCKGTAETDEMRRYEGVCTDLYLHRDVCLAESPPLVMIREDQEILYRIQQALWSS